RRATAPVQSAWPARSPDRRPERRAAVPPGPAAGYSSTASGRAGGAAPSAWAAATSTTGSSSSLPATGRRGRRTRPHSLAAAWTIPTKSNSALRLPLCYQQGHGRRRQAGFKNRARSKRLWTGCRVCRGARAIDNGFRWLTFWLKTQPDLEIILMAVKESPMFPADKVALLRKLVESGTLGAGVMHVDDCYKTYEELKAKG